MSHLTKILLRLVMNRNRNKTRSEVAQEQFGCIEGKGTTNAMHTLRIVIERSIEIQQDIYLCFLDFSKAFDTVNMRSLCNCFKHLNIDGRDLN